MKIKFHSLKEGISVYDFETSQIDVKAIYESYQVGLVAVQCTLNKTAQALYVRTRFNAPVDFICDNCLKEFGQQIEEEFTILYTRDERAVDNSNEEVVHVLSALSQEIDLTEGIRDSLILAIPMRVLCSVQCKGLCPDCGADLNEEGCSCSHESFDPRWESLRKLLNPS